MGDGVRVWLLDGTYELFRHFYGQPSRSDREGREVGALRGVLLSVMAMLSEGATHLGVATDHVIESFRNDLWAGYKTGAGVDPQLMAQFIPLEEALDALGVVVWPMVELEADDALASVAAQAAAQKAVEQVIVCTPDKDLAQCVVAERVVQLDRRRGVVADEEAVREKFGVDPASIPDWLALVGDSADGFPGIAGWGKRTASVVLAHYHKLEAIPARAADWAGEVSAAVRGADKLAARLNAERDLAELFRLLATLRTDGVTCDLDDLRWRGPAPEFARLCERLGDPALARRAAALAGS
jgi:5'-3' exonuclease